MDKQKFTINQYFVDLTRAEITFQGSVQSMEPKVAHVLTTLYEAQGEIVSQQELLDTVWPDVIVSPNTIQRCIAQLRKLLGDDAKSQQAIKTHPKRGYSIAWGAVVQGETSLPSLIQSEEPKTNLYLITIGIVVVIVISIALVVLMKAPKSTSTPQSTLKVEQFHQTFIDRITPITVDSHNVLEVATAPSGKFIAFIREVDDHHQLVYQEANSTNERVLLDDFRSYSKLMIADNNSDIYFAKLTNNNSQKCIQIARYSLATKLLANITPCEQGFRYQPLMASEQQLIYLGENNQGKQLVMLYSLASNTETVLFEPSEAVLTLEFSSKTGHLYWLGAEGKVHYSYLDLIQNRLTKIEALPFNNSSVGRQSIQGADLFWHNPATLALVANNTIYFYQGNKLLKSFSVPMRNQLTRVSVLPNENKYIAILSQTDKQVSKRRFIKGNKTEDNMILASKFHERLAKFRPQSHQVSVLSNRSGTMQVWLDTSESARQITLAEHSIEDYIWVNHNQLIFIANQRLWLQQVSSDNNVKMEAAKQLSFHYEPNTLMQSIGNELLVSVKHSNNLKLVKYSLGSDKVEDLTGTSPSWAQYLDSNRILMADTRGKLSLRSFPDDMLIDNALPEELKAMILQYRFIVDRNAVYLQDKQRRLLKYLVNENTVQYIGHYDEKSLFMTDFNGERAEMLSELLDKQSRELVELTYN